MVVKSIAQRKDEFVKYHNEGDGECNTVTLKEWAGRNGLTEQERFELAYMFAITYNVPSAIEMFRSRQEIYKGPKKWAAENKAKLIFQSDRKYMRMRDSFSRCLLWFTENRKMPAALEGPEVDLDQAIRQIEKWPMFGRFSAFLFLEMFLGITKRRYKNTTIDWKNGNTATSGLLNVYGLDKAADAFDKTGELRISPGKMDNMLSDLLEAIESAGGSPNVTEVETSLCAYRKFYKGSRYNGYYLDRMLEELNALKEAFPKTVEEIFEIRREMFPAKYLGEVCGWRGVRTGMKKVYRETGIVT